MRSRFLKHFLNEIIAIDYTYKPISFLLLLHLCTQTKPNRMKTKTKKRWQHEHFDAIAIILDVCGASEQGCYNQCFVIVFATLPI